ncbi:hypothetical protein [Noviherbaspirillum galbum]|uniref:Uncharacterized protein n=1 Tax=Noviherbaspirillum galbum TaxID=2709383 RepID=A0A6B3SGG7_9BURK|nr:hypothetical protein [Noviherbaspirillum galbum]NEX59977.1 hypothetical protein [Noviherbaspirillum galbum]
MAGGLLLGMSGALLAALFGASPEAGAATGALLGSMGTAPASIGAMLAAIDRKKGRG